MNSSGDAAESIVRMSLQGIDVAARITGSASKNVAVLIYTIMKDKKMSKGKTNLGNMLKTGKELKVFAVKQEDLKKFTEEAKRYGVLFCALVDKKKGKSPDGLVDVMVRAEDAAKINRIVTRFKLSAPDVASIKSEVEKDKIEQALKEAKEKGIEVKTVEDQLVDDILSKPIKKEENEVDPLLAKTEKSPLSEPFSKSKNKNEEGTKSLEKPSVREELKNISKKIKEEKGLEKSQELKKDGKVQKTEHKHQKQKGKKKKTKERG